MYYSASGTHSLNIMSCEEEEIYSLTSVHRFKTERRAIAAAATVPAPVPDRRLPARHSKPQPHTQRHHKQQTHANPHKHIRQRPAHDRRPGKTPPERRRLGRLNSGNNRSHAPALATREGRRDKRRNKCTVLVILGWNDRQRALPERAGFEMSAVLAFI